MQALVVGPRVCAAAVLCILWGAWGHAQETVLNGAALHGRRTLRAERTDLPIVVDGDLSKPVWQNVEPAGNFLQKEPFEGAPATEKTEVRVLYTATFLYIGVAAYDSDPSGIAARERRRDGDLGGDDSVKILLDTFHDHRNAFQFATNPLGTQWDALATDEGRVINTSWDERWQVATRINEDGWTAEFAIPFKSLRVPVSDNGLVWGLEIERNIRRKNEVAYFNNHSRAFGVSAMSHAGHLTGLDDIETGLRLRVKPYVVAGFSNTTDRPNSDLCRSADPLQNARLGGATCNASNVGIEVFKYRITPSLTADLTWNTDFAQTDVDDLQVNLERFPRLFPEKREFFQEGAGIFEFGRAGAATTSMRLFHSRQIGLSPRRRAVPIVGGGRITGKLQGFQVGLLNAQTEALDIEGIPASNYSVARVKRDIFARSTVGAFLLNRELAGRSDYNRVFGIDAAMTFFKYLTVDGFFARSDSPADQSSDGTRWVHNTNFNWDDDRFQIGVDYLSIDPGFRDDIGFLSRSDVHRVFPSVMFRPRPTLPWVRRLEFGASWDYTMNASNDVSRRTDKYIFQTVFQDEGVLRIIPYDYELDVVERDFELNPGVAVPAGRYQWNVLVLRYNFSPKRVVSGALDFSHRYGFYGGNMYKWQLTPTLRLSRQFVMQTNYEINVASVPGGEFSHHVVNLGINYSFNNQWLTSTTIQYDNVDAFAGLHFRLNYIFRPGDDFFLVYTEGRDVGGPLDGKKDRSLKAKLTYSFDY